METRAKKYSNDKENLGAVKRSNRAKPCRQSISCNNETENRKLNSYSNKRQPLGNLDTNIKVPMRDQQTQYIKLSSRPTAEENQIQTTRISKESIRPININNNTKTPPKVRSKPQCTAIKDTKISIAERKNVTARRRLTSASNINVDLNKSFLDGTTCTAFNPPKVSLPIKRKASQLSPIWPNVYTSKSTLLLQGIPDEANRPAKRINLTHQNFSLDLYNAEYLEDIVYHQMNNNWKHVAKKDFLKIQNADEDNRATIVNWLIEVVDYLEQPIYVLFMSIRLLDNILGSTCVAKNMYQLSALVVMWMLSKLDDNINAISMSNMVLLSKQAYTNRQFLKMERKLLKFFNYELMMPDVTIFVTFYLKNLNLEKEEKILNCVHYVLECYSLSSEFSTVIYSKQAAAAICLTLNVLCPNNNIWIKLKNLAAYHSTKELEEIMHKMLEQIHMIQDPTYKHRQPFLKYSNPEKLQASIILLRKLVAS